MRTIFAIWILMMIASGIRAQPVARTRSGSSAETSASKP
jgi:hypothetical protein